MNLSMIQKLTLGFALLILSSLFLPEKSQALPVFARKYGLPCSACHTAFPKLNPMGVAFRERGFRMVAGSDDLAAQSERGGNIALSEDAIATDSLPLAIRTQLSYANSTGVFGGVDGAGEKNPLFGPGEFGLLTSGSYNEFSWWGDATLNGLEMLEGQYYFSDLVKLRFGQLQNNIGYGMTMMSNRPLGVGAKNLAMTVEGSMLAMSNGIGLNGTTNGDTGMGTGYSVSFNSQGKPENVSYYNGGKALALDATKAGQATFARVFQEIAGSTIGLYNKSGSNLWMTSKNTAGFTTVMFKDSLVRTGLDFAYHYGQPFQVWGAFTQGEDKGKMDMTKGMAMTYSKKLTASTISAEWQLSPPYLLGAKYDAQSVDTTVKGKSTTSETTNSTLFFLTQLAQNVQLSFAQTNSVTDSKSTGTYNVTVDFVL